MHSSAMMRMAWFIDNYIPTDKQVNLLDVGSYNVNGCYRDIFNKSKFSNVVYTGLDLTSGPNVDIVVKNCYDWSELPDNSFDFIISGNAFEHIEYPWLTMEQIYNKLKPNGITCILTPFNLSEHKYPLDCYRYYPDGMRALASWARLAVIDCTTGGLPKGTSEKWAGAQNYDDTTLIAIKGFVQRGSTAYPKLSDTFRSSIIYPGG